MIEPPSSASLWHSAFFLHVWQSTIFVVAIWLLTLALRRNAARTRYRLWMVASVKFLIPFSLLVAAGQVLHDDFGSTAGQATFLPGVERIEQPLFAAGPVVNHAAARVSTALPASAPAHHAISILWFLAAIWAVGAIVLLVRWTRSWWRIRKALRSSSSLDLPFPVPVRATESRIEPGVFGIFRPVLLLPQGLTDRLSPSQLEAILAHERCHVRRRDNLSAALHMVVEVLFWFHPAVWWIQARLLEERELACDERVLASHGEAHSYAEGILNVCKFYVEAPMNCMSGVTGSDLKKRIARVMSHHREHPLNAGMKIMLVAAALVAVALPLSFGIVRPLRAQAQPAAKPNHSIVGTWQGTLHARKRSFRTVLKIKKSSAGRMTGMFYFIDQARRGFPTSSIRFQNGDLKYAISMNSGRYEGRMSANGNSITGTWTQGSVSLPLVLERATPETAWTIPPSGPRVAPMPANANPGIEVATINPTKPGTRGHYRAWRGGQLVFVGWTLDQLIQAAYSVQDKQIVNSPSWIRSEKLDITAKPNVAGTPSTQQIAEMEKDLLADRFQLKVHTEDKVMPAYVLTVAKSGPKMQKSSSTGALPGQLFGPPTVTLRVVNATMNDFTHIMQRVVLDRPVVDQTGLAGRWTFSLNWSPDASQFANAGFRFPPPSNPAKAPPPLFTAIQQQLGLKLGIEKTSVPVLVIDHVAHPSPN